MISVLLVIISCNLCVFFTESDGDNSSSPISPVQLSAPSTPTLKRIVPAPDSSYIKKKKIQDNVAVIDIHSKNINLLTDKLTKCLESSVPPTTQQNQPEDALFLSVSAALLGVPQEKRLSCIIKILQVVQKYTMKK